MTRFTIPSSYRVARHCRLISKGIEPIRGSLRPSAGTRPAGLEDLRKSAAGGTGGLLLLQQPRYPRWVPWFQAQPVDRRLCVPTFRLVCPVSVFSRDRSINPRGINLSQKCDGTYVQWLLERLLRCLLERSLERDCRSGEKPSPAIL